jgi:hypothetical protein
VSKRLPNPRLAKIHRSYTVEEVARLYDIHRNTVRQWIKHGLPICDDRRPKLILGSDLALYLTAKRTCNKRPCKTNELYCLRCRAPKTPALGMVDYSPVTAVSGNLIGICPSCETVMYRRVNVVKLSPIQAILDVTLPLALRHIDESCKPSVNSDFNAGAENHVKTQRK